VYFVRVEVQYRFRTCSKLRMWDKERALSIRNASYRKDGDVAVWEGWGEAIVTGVHGPIVLEL